MNAFRFARAAVKPVAQVRKFSAGGDAAKEVAQWTKMTGIMCALSGVLIAYNVVAHDHEHATTGLPYMKIRNRPYAWECSDCNLFDGDCWKECRANKQ